MSLDLIDHPVVIYSKYADIYTLHGPHPFISLARVVAVKVPRASPCNSELRLRQNQLLTDLDLIVPPSGLETMICPSLVASILTSGGLAMARVLPWFENGNVLAYVKNHPVANKLQFVQDLAIGLEYVHSQEMVVGNVHPGNVMVTLDQRALLADVGLNALMSRLAFETEGRCRVPEAWAYKPAEEIFPLHGTVVGGMVQHTMAMDVYSFATTAYAIFEAESPFHNEFLTVEQGIMEIYTRGHGRLTKPTEMSQPLWNLLRRCLEREPPLRPSMTEVVIFLRTFF